MTASSQGGGAADKNDNEKENEVPKVHPGKIYAKMTPEEKKVLPDAALWQMWLNNKVETLHIESVSYEVYTSWINAIKNYLTANKLRIIDIKPTDVLNFKNYLEGLGRSKWTIVAYLNVLKNMLVMLHDMNVKEYDWPKVIRYKRYKQVDEYRIPTPAQIFAIRRKPQVKIRMIVMFELFAGSGARFGEVAQLRGSDITFDNKVVDLELKRLSPYIGGHLTLLPKRGRIKSQRGKIIYFSTFAAKWLKLYMKLMQADKYPHLPLFACHRNNAARWFYTLGHGIFSHKQLGSRVINQQLDEMQRKPGFGDINTAELKDIPEHIRKMIRSSQKADAERRDQHELLNKLESAQYTASNKKDILHMHALRHFFAGLMLHRAYNGTRDNIVSVQRLLHHANLSETEDYLRKVKFEVSDDEWKRVLLGRLTDWPDADLTLRAVSMKGSGSRLVKRTR